MNARSAIFRIACLLTVGSSAWGQTATTVFRTLVYHEITSLSTNPNFGGPLGPVLSRDGSRAVFSTSRGDPHQLMVVNADGGSPPAIVDSYTAGSTAPLQISANDDASAIATNDGQHIRFALTGGSGGQTVVFAVGNVPFSAIRLASTSSILFLMDFDYPLNGSMVNTPAGVYMINTNGTGLTRIVSAAAVQSVLGTSAVLIFSDGALPMVDVSADGLKIIFTVVVSGMGSFLMAVNSNGQNLRVLSGPNNGTYGAGISSDGTTVYYKVIGTNGVPQVVAVNFDGSSPRILAGALDGKGPPGQITSDGSQVLIADDNHNIGRVYRTDGSGFYLPVIDDHAATPAPVISGGNGSMNSSATRFLYIVPDNAGVLQLATVDVNTTSLGAAPAISNPSIQPSSVLTHGNSAATAAAQITVPSGETLLGALATVISGPPAADAGLPNPNVSGGVLTAGANNTYSINSIRTDCCAAVSGSEYVRIQAEGRIGGIGTRRHGTAVDVAPFSIVNSAFVNVTVATSPPGLSVIVDGITYTAAGAGQVFAWSVGDSHTITAVSPQLVSGTTYTFSSWSDGGAQSHSVTAPSAATTYTANFSGAALSPHLTIAKTHSGNFTQGQIGATYSIAVANSGSGPTSGSVTVSENPPAGLTVTALAGSGWTCNGTSCSRNDTLAANASYAPIIVTVNVAGNAPAGLTNSATVSGGGDPNPHTANDPTTVTQSAASLSISKTHSGNFLQRQNGATYTITVANVGQPSTSGAVTVTDNLPAGMALVGMSGSAWNCTGATCSRSDPLPSNSSYPPITVTVNVADNAPASLTNSATVSGGGDPNSHTANDPTTIIGVFTLRISKTHSGNFTQGQIGATYTITIDNLGFVSSTAPITVTDTIPSGLTATDMSGQGWNCSGTTCSRNDLLASNTSYPPIIVTVNVAANAPPTVTNVASFTGGGTSQGASASDPTTILGSTLSPVLSITKSHSGNFVRGQTGATYTLTVTNTGQASTTGAVTVNDSVPAGLTATAISGSGWTCGGTSCSRTDSLAPNSSYPPIVLTVNVAANAPSSLTNSASVSGGGSASATANDPTTIGSSSSPSLNITKTHSGSFTRGQQGAKYTLTVSNAAGAATENGLVVVTETVPAGLTLVSMTGTGWMCSGNSCVEFDPLLGGSSYPPITVTVNVAANAPSTVINQASVQDDFATANASDPTTVNPAGGGGVTLTMGSGFGPPGGIVQLPINIATVGTLPGNFQVDMNFDPAKLAFVSAAAGPKLTAASKTLSLTPLSAGVVRLLAAGLNQNTISDGVVANVTFSLNSGFTAGATTPVSMSNCLSSDVNGVFLTTNCVAGVVRSGAIRCDLNADQGVAVDDVQIIINMALGVIAATAQADLNSDGSVNVADVQIMINVVLGVIACPN